MVKYIHHITIYTEVTMDLLKRLQDWYCTHCNGDWEHYYGIKIDTLDNPGGIFTADLSDTMLENAKFVPVRRGSSDSDDPYWLECYKEDERFYGAGGIGTLTEIISIFLDWAERNTKTYLWDKKVEELIERCELTDDVTEMRKVYRELDAVPTEHPRKKELIRLFDERWFDIKTFTEESI